MAHSKSGGRPEKPYDDFPLFPHAAGMWTKKIDGKHVSFGSWRNDPEGKAALLKYHDTVAGRPLIASGLSLGDLCNRFLSVKEDLVESKERVRRTFNEYKRVTDRLIDTFGKHRVVETLTAEDFESLRRDISKTMSPVSRGNFINIARGVFKFGYENDMLEKPVRFGTTFKRPDRKTMRLVKKSKGVSMFKATEVKLLLEGADEQMKAMILLGANCGFGNADCGQLPISALDLKAGMVQFPRPKTGIDRRCPLWPETIAALNVVLKNRKRPKDITHDRFVFITKYGQPWFRDNSDNPVSQQFKKLLDDLGLYRKGLGFYSLRRGFETVAGDTGDQVATDFIMGHAPDGDDMAAVYRQAIFAERLQKVVNHVHTWLYPPEPEKKPAKKAPKKKTAK